MSIKRYSILLLIISLTSCGNGEEATTPQVKPLMEAVYASGHVVSRGEYQVYAQAEGYLVDKRVDDGDSVKKGDIIFVLDADQQTARYRIAKENYQVALNDYSNDSPVLRELKAALDAAKTKMEFDSVNFVRYTNLLRQDAVSKSEYDRMKLAYENSQNEYTLQKSRLEKTKNQLRQALNNAESQLRIASDESSLFQIKSQLNGTVFSTSKEEGELVRRGEMVAVIGNEENFYLQLNVDELDINRIKKGQKVLVKIDAYPNKVFQATVSQIYPMVDKRQQSIKVDATLNDPLPGAFTGLALEANIVIREKQDALVIPKTSLLSGDSVLVERDGEEKKIKVETGIITLEEVEIVEGITEEDKLLVSQ